MVRRSLLLLAVAACGSRHATKAPSAPAPRRPDAAIEGLVTDAETGAGVEGVTVVAEEDFTHANSAEITDRTGHFRLAVGPGGHHVTMYFADRTLPGGHVDVASRGAASLAFTLSHDVVLEALAAASREECPESPRGPTAAGDDRDALIAAALEHYLADPASVVEGKLVARAAHVYVASDGDPELGVTAGSIPASMVLSSMRDLQAGADRLGTDIGYIAVFAVDIVGDCATIGVAARFVSPRGSKYSPPHCGTSFMFSKRDDRWSFKAKIHDMCE